MEPRVEHVARREIYELIQTGSFSDIDDKKSLNRQSADHVTFDFKASQEELPVNQTLR